MSVTIVVGFSPFSFLFLPQRRRHRRLVAAKAARSELRGSREAGPSGRGSGTPEQRRAHEQEARLRSAFKKNHTTKNRVNAPNRA